MVRRTQNKTGENMKKIMSTVVTTLNVAEDSLLGGLLLKIKAAAPPTPSTAVPSESIASSSSTFIDEWWRQVTGIVEICTEASGFEKAQDGSKEGS